MILVDTCVLLDLSTGDPVWFDWSLRQITHFGSVATLVYNSVIYAETGDWHSERAPAQRNSRCGKKAEV